MSVKPRRLVRSAGGSPAFADACGAVVRPAEEAKFARPARTHACARTGSAAGLDGSPGVVARCGRAARAPGRVCSFVLCGRCVTFVPLLRIESSVMAGARGRWSALRPLASACVSCAASPRHVRRPRGTPAAKMTAPHTPQHELCTSYGTDHKCLVGVREWLMASPWLPIPSLALRAGRKTKRTAASLDPGPLPPGPLDPLPPGPLPHQLFLSPPPSLVMSSEVPSVPSGPLLLMVNWSLPDFL